MISQGAPMPEGTPVVVQIDERVARLNLARPPLNILELELIAALDDALAALPDTVQLVVLGGRGGKAFSAGVSVQDHTPDKVGAMLRGFHGVLRRILELDAIVLAVVEGHCLGGGMELAMACDLVLASDDARFAQPEIQLGCYPPVAAALYPAVIGAQRTAELLLTDRKLTAAEARDWGLVNWVSPRAELDAAAARIIADLTGKSAAVTALTKRAISAGRRLPWREALDEVERMYLGELAATQDMNEGIAAFLARRAPVWRHR
jgi:cyclohexa-1,5-dienecarbonyl-CoA hydratase